MRNVLDWFVAVVMLAAICIHAVLRELWGIDKDY